MKEERKEEEKRRKKERTKERKKRGKIKLPALIDRTRPEVLCSPQLPSAAQILHFETVCKMTSI